MTTTTLPMARADSHSRDHHHDDCAGDLDRRTAARTDHDHDDAAGDVSDARIGRDDLLERRRINHRDVSGKRRRTEECRPGRRVPGDGAEQLGRR